MHPLTLQSLAARVDGLDLGLVELARLVEDLGRWRASLLTPGIGAATESIAIYKFQAEHNRARADAAEAALAADNHWKIDYQRALDERDAARAELASAKAHLSKQGEAIKVFGMQIRDEVGRNDSLSSVIQKQDAEFSALRADILQRCKGCTEHCNSDEYNCSIFKYKPAAGGKE